jgi:hypothetical protein
VSSTNNTVIPRADLLQLIQGIGQIAVIWNGEAVPYHGADDAWATLDIMSYRGKGIDQQRQAYDAVRDELSTNQCGIRLFTLTIRVDSYSFDLPAYELLEKVRRRLRGGASMALLRDMGVALVNFHPIVDLNVIADNRPVYASTMDVAMSFTVNETDGQAGGDYIASVGDTPTTPGIVPNPPLTT